MCVSRDMATLLLLAASLLIAWPPTAAATSQDPPARAVVLQYLGHSCFVVTAPEGDRLVIDPYASGEWPGLSLPHPHADRVLVSHPHWDHSASREVRGHPKVTDVPGTAKMGGFVVRGFEGRHARAGGESIGYRNIVFVIETGGLRICHLGDNEAPAGASGEGAGPLAEAIKAGGPIDVLMLPVDAEHRVLTDEDAKRWIEALSPRIVIPMHYLLPGLSHPSVRGLGTIAEWLALQPDVERVKGDTLVLRAGQLPAPGAASVRVFTLPGERTPDPNLPPAGTPGAAEAEEAARRAVTAAAAGDTATALEQFMRAAALDPNDARVLGQIGFLHMGAKRPERALEFFTRAGALAGEHDPKAASIAWLGTGMAQDLLGRREEALAAYRKVVEIGVNDDNQIDQARRLLESPYTED